MITDQLSYSHFYHSFGSAFKIAFDFLRCSDLLSVEPGNYEIGASGIYAIVQEYKTRNKTGCSLECHQKNIDIQFMVKGSERVGYAHQSVCKAYSYNEHEDHQKLEGDADFFTLNPGCFAIFFPHDAHMSGIQIRNKAQLVKKIVIKVPVHLLGEKL